MKARTIEEVGKALEEQVQKRRQLPQTRLMPDPEQRTRTLEERIAALEKEVARMRRVTNLHEPLR